MKKNNQTENCFFLGGNGLSLNKLLEELSFLSEIEVAVKKRISEKTIAEIAASAYSGEDFNFALCRRMPMTRLTVITFLLLQKYGEYKAKGVSDRIIFDTFKDVSLRARLYYIRTGKVGISKEDVIWFRHIMNVNIFKIGSLQFQPFEMVYLDEETIGEPYMTFDTEQKTKLPSGTPVINCHIQQGADLTPCIVQQSMDGAKSFFQTHFREKHFLAFLCYSWLLYPPMTKQLSMQSNIRLFAKRFSIIGYCDDSTQAKSYLFEDRQRPDADKMTSLQKMAVNHTERFGFACGIISLLKNPTPQGGRKKK